MDFRFDLMGEPLRIIDIGARAVPGSGPAYKTLLENLHCTVKAIDPDSSTNNDLERNPDCQVHNIALGNGGSAQLNICNMPSCSSILLPNFKMLSQYSGMEYFYRVSNQQSLCTQRFDDYFPEANFDYLDIDVQGYELEVLRHGQKNLSNLLVLHIEVGFVEKYQDQPLFPAIDLFLKEQGFQFHCFTGYGTRAPNGIKINGSIINGTNQWLWADAVYIHDFANDDFWSRGNRLIKAAAIFHYIYGSYDFAAAALDRYDKCNNTNNLTGYLASLACAGCNIEIAADDEAYLAELVHEINYVEN